MIEGLLIAILIITFQIYLNSRKKGVNEIVDKIDRASKEKGEIIELPVNIDNILK